MPTLSVLLVHPDPQIRQVLRTRVEAVDFLRVLGECVSGEEAMELLTAIPYGVCCVGTYLAGEMTGFDVAHQLMARQHRPALILLADSEEHAFTAFELDATDYLIIPCAEDRFKRTVDRLRQFQAHFRLVPEPQSNWREPQPAVPEQTCQQPESPTVEDHCSETVQLPLADEEQDQFLSALKNAWDDETPRPDVERLPITQDGKTMLLPYHEIIFVEAYEDYSYVHTSTQKYLTTYRLKVLEGRLKPHRFFRVHRKYLVNLDMVTEIATTSGSNCMLRTAGRTRIELPISRRRMSELKQVLGL